MFGQHKKLRGFIVPMLLLATNSFPMHARTLAKGENRINIIRQFYSLRERTLDERGSEKDVNLLFGLMTPDAIYEHPRANVKMTREQAHDGIIAHLNEGKNAHITLDNIKTGVDFIVVELTLQYDAPATNGGFEKVNRRGITIFEFAGNKIQRVAEY
jgi:hypothetical protein